MHSFPNPTSIEALHAWRADTSQWLPIAINIAVIALDQRLILKIFPPLLRHQFDSERAALARLHGRLSIPVPQIVFEGERERVALPGP
jgi:hygromycin-B 7''-O-kinase